MINKSNYVPIFAVVAEVDLCYGICGASVQSVGLFLKPPDISMFSAFSVMIFRHRHFSNIDSFSAKNHSLGGGDTHVYRSPGHYL